MQNGNTTSRPEVGKTTGTIGGGARKAAPDGLGRTRLARELFGGRYRPGQSVRLREVAEEYKLDNDSVLKAFAEFQALGMVTLSGNLAIVHAPNPKEMQEAYEMRAALEEIAGRTAATSLKGNTAGLQNELEIMRAAVRDGNLDAYTEHNVKFHRSILKASGNEVLLRVWDTLAFDLRIRAVIGKVSKDLPEVIESHQPIVDALEKGRGREAGLLMRNHVETFLEYLKKSELDAGFHGAQSKDLEGAKDVQQAFLPPRSLSIPCISCETFYQPAHSIGGDYYDLLSLPEGRWGIAIGDVSGKGIGAALLMASLQASLRAQALHPHLDLSTLIGDVNRLVHESSPTNFFASLFYAEYEPATRVLKYANAGHNAPIVVRRGMIHARCTTWNPGGCRWEFQQTRNSQPRLFSSRLMMCWLLTRMGSRRLRTLMANSGESRGSRICCVLAAVKRQSKSLNASCMKYQRSRMASRSGTMPLSWS